MTKEIKDKIWPSLTTEEMTKKTKAILDMFVNVEDMEVCLSNFNLDLFGNHFYQQDFCVFILESLNLFYRP